MFSIKKLLLAISLWNVSLAEDISIKRYTYNKIKYVNNTI